MLASQKDQRLEHEDVEREEIPDARFEPVDGLVIWESLASSHLGTGVIDGCDFFSADVQKI